MPVDTVPSAEQCNCFAVRAAARHVSQSYDRFLAPTGLRTTQYSILVRLKRGGPLTINALAEAMVMDRTTLGRNILPLQRDGLIKIEASATDGRAKELRLTKAGEKRLEAGRAAWVQATREGRLVAQRMRRERTDAVNTAIGGLGEREQRLIERALPALESLAEQLKERRP